MENVLNRVLCGDSLVVLKTLPSESVDCVVTSPPYWALRDYGVYGQLGLEPTFHEYITKLCDIFDEVKRVLKKEGTCWVNLGDTYSGNKEGKTDEKVSDYLKEQSNGIHKKAIITEKCLCQIPSRFAIEMTNRGWILRNKLIWYKRNCMPSSVSDRFTVDFEEIFFFTKSKKYWFEKQFVLHAQIDSRRNQRIAYNGKGNPDTRQFSGGANYLGQGVCGRNMRCVWDITTKGYPEAHFATYPENLVETPIKAGCPQFICKKCGKSREPIFESNYVKKEVEWHSEKYGIEDEQAKRLGRLQPAGEVKNTSRKIGYTDCGCNAGFEGGVVLDPFFGAGTTGLVARKLLRNWIGIELNPKYIEIAKKRITEVPQRLDIFCVNKSKDVICDSNA